MTQKQENAMYNNRENLCFLELIYIVLDQHSVMHCDTQQIPLSKKL